VPFTISHAAAVLPFTRLLARWRLLSATVIGSMVPDFRVFFTDLSRVETHSAVALITFCLPVGMVTYWVFQGLVRTAVLEVLPEGPYARWRPLAAPANIHSIRQWLLAACGILVGALSHLLWDAFTHAGGRGVRMFPVLDDSIIEIGWRHVPAMYALQDLGSLFGLAAVVAIIGYGLRRGNEKPVPGRLVAAPERVKWMLAFAITFATFTVAFYFWSRWGVRPTRSIVLRVAAFAIASLRGLAAALLVVSLALDVRLRALRYRSSGPER
jgi:Domain of unknown function (DUF4184)